jgi:ATP-dependent helicase/nuclease subunit B
MSNKPKLHNMLSSIPSGADLVITANFRQAQLLSFSLNNVLPVVSWDKWILTLWHQVALSQYEKLPTILDDAEIRELFEQIILEWSADKAPLINAKAAAKNATNAYNMSIRYNHAIDDCTQTFSSEEVKAMAHWAKSMTERLRGTNVITQAYVEKKVLAWLQVGKLNATATVFYGFYFPTYLQKEVMKTLNDQANFHYLQNKNEVASSLAYRFNNKQEEVVGCAKWVRAEVEADHGINIGVIAPTLDAYRSDLVRTFDVTLKPSSITNPLENQTRPYKISMGESLFDSPIIKTLFSILSIRNYSRFTIEQVSSLLRNPLIGGYKTEHVFRSKRDLAFRKLGLVSISWEILLRELSVEVKSDSCVPYFCPDFNQRMIETKEALSLLGSRKILLSEVGSYVHKLAQIWGLNVGEHLTDTQNQALHALFGHAEEEGVLDSMNKISTLYGKVTLTEGIRKIRELTHDTMHQAKSSAVNITILSEADAIGIHFDKVWVLGMNAVNFPKKAQPNPLIDRQVQIELNIPHASAEQELFYAQKTLSMLSRSTNEIIFSGYVSENGREILESPIIKQYANFAHQSEQVHPLDWYVSQLSSHAKVSLIEDNKAPSLQEGEVVHGGTGLLKAQSLCPFKGFVENRLNVRAIEEPEVGLSASMRGDILHSVMEKFWREVKNQATLIELFEAKVLFAVVAKNTSMALQYFAKKRPDIFSKPLIDIENKRITKLVNDWLIKEELHRKPFEHVETETSESIDLGAIKLNIKMDHIDHDVEGGQVNISDNKSGKVTHEDWMSERLLDPQVPLYVVKLHEKGEKIGSATFKSIKQGAFATKGLSDLSGRFVKIKGIGEEKLAQTIDTWSLQLKDIAQEYQNGRAKVMPYHATKSCQYCSLKSVCRVGDSL